VVLEKLQQQNFLISANSFVQRAGIKTLSKTGDAHVDRMRSVYDKHQKLMVDLMREVGFGACQGSERSAGAFGLWP
jgi:DNA-binding transcriptional MocR family regulator